MAYYLQYDNGNQEQVCSNDGWNAVGAWIDTVEPDHYPNLVHLREHGYANDVAGLAEEMAGAAEVYHDSTGHDVYVEQTIRDILKSLRANRGAVVLSQGMSA